MYKKKVFVPSWLCGERGYNIKDTGDAYIDFSNLEVGDFLIHEDFGVGEYVGLSDVEGEEFLVLKYKDAQIKVFPSFFDKISLFKKSGDICDLDSIGRGSSWKRRVSSTKKSLSVFVDSLYENYMQRKQIVGQQFYIDPEIESAFTKIFSHRYSDPLSLFVAGNKKGSLFSRANGETSLWRCWFWKKQR